MKKVLFTLILFATFLLSARSSFSQCTPAGDPAVFGDHVWNVYAWNAGGQSDTGAAWNLNYSGYYVDTAFNFNTTTQWGTGGAPSDATGYMGCSVGVEGHSWSAKRKGFPCGYYTISITGHDDEGQLFVHGVNVWTHDGCCDSHSGVFTGFLDDTTSIDFRVTEGGGASYGSLLISPVAVLQATSLQLDCHTSNITLSATVSGSYLWSTGATSSSIAVTTPGIYTLTVDNGGECVLHSSAHVISQVTPTVSLSGPSCLGGGAFLSASTTGTLAAIQWRLNNSPIQTNFGTWGSPSVVAGSNGDGGGANQLSGPTDAVVDNDGNLYITDAGNGRVVKWAPGATSGTTILSGISNPHFLCLDAAQNLYVADWGNNRVLKMAYGSQTTTVVAGGNGYGNALNQLNLAGGICVDAAGNLYVSDVNNYRVMKWAPGATQGVVVAGGNGYGSNANQLTFPYGLALDASGNLYICDNSNYRVQKWAPGATSGTTVAGGNGYGQALNQINPIDIWVDGSGNMIISENFTSRILGWSEGASSGKLIAGGSFLVSGAGGIFVNTNGDLYAVSYYQQAVSRMQRTAGPATLYTATAAGNYSVIASSFSGCSASASHTVNPSPLVNGKTAPVVCGGGTVTLTASNGNSYTWNPGNLSGAVQNVSPTSSTTYTVTSDNGCATTATVEVNSLTVGASCQNSNYLLASAVQPALLTWQMNGSTIKSTIATWNSGTFVAGNNGQGSAANQLQYPQGVAVDDAGNVYVCDQANFRIQKWVPGATQGITVAGGNGYGGGANQLGYPYDVWVDHQFNLYVVDQNYGRVQKFANGSTTGVTVAGGNGTSGSGGLWGPSAMCLDEQNNIYVVDASNNRVMKYAPGSTDGVVVAGGNGPGGGADQLYFPSGVAVDAAGNVYVMDKYNYRVQKWAPSATSGITVAGGNSYGTALNQFNNAGKIAIDGAGNLYVADYSFSTIRVWSPGSSQADIISLPGAIYGASAVRVTSAGDVYVCGYTTDYPPSNSYVIKYSPNGFKNYPPPSTGNYSVTVTSFNGCSITSPVAAVNPSPYIVQGSQVNACTGSGVTLTAAGTQNYLWTPGNVAGATQTFYPSANTTYTVTDDHNCTASTITTLYSSIDVSVTGTACTNKLLAAATSTIPASVQWKKDGTTVYSEAPQFNVNGVTVAGGNGSGAGLNQLYYPSQGIVVDAAGNMYVSDAGNNRVMKYTGGSTTGVVVAGGNGGGSNDDQLRNPQGIYLDAAGNLYVADAGNYRVQKFAPGQTHGVTVAGGNGQGGALNQFSFCYVVCFDATGNMYVLDQTGNSRVTKWAPAATQGVVVAGGNGGGPGDNQLWVPLGMVVDGAGNIYISDNQAHRIQKWTPGATSGVTIMPNTGGALGLWRDAAGYFYFSSNYKVCRFKEGDNGYTTALNTTQGSASNQINNPSNGCIDSYGNMYLIDGNHRVQKYTTSSIILSYVPALAGNYTAVATSFAGCPATSNAIAVGQAPVVAADFVSTCSGGSATLSVTNSGSFTWNPGGITGSSVTVSPSSPTTYTVSDNGNNCGSTVTVSANTPITSTVSGANCIGNGNLSATTSATPARLDWKLNGTTVRTDFPSYNTYAAVTVAGGNGNGGALNQWDFSYGMCMDDAGNIYIADRYNYRVVKWAPGATQGVVVAGGNGNGSAPNQLSFATGLAVDHQGNLYVADAYNSRVQKFAPGSPSGVTVAGGNGQGIGLNQLYYPFGISVDPAGNLYVADQPNHRIMKWTPGSTQGVVVAGGNGSGASANQLSSPYDVVLDASGNLYISDFGNNRVQKWAPGASSGTTVAGNGTMGYGPVQLNYPNGLSLDGAGNLYIMNSYYNMIWRWEPGATQGTYMAGYCCSGTGSLNYTSKICIGPDGSLYAVDNNKVLKYPVNTWTSSDYTPAADGDYSVVTTSFAGCANPSNTVTTHLNPTINLTGNQYFCQGASTTLDAGTHQQYAWSTGSTSQTATISTEGSYSVTVTDFGCSSSSSFFVNNATPNFQVSTTSPFICSGQSAQLNATLVSGGGLITKTYYVPASSISNMNNSCSYGTIYGYNYYFDINWTDAGVGTMQSVKADFTVGYEDNNQTYYYYNTYSASLNSGTSTSFNRTAYNTTCSPASPSNRISLALSGSYNVGGNNSIRIYKPLYGNWGFVQDSAWNNQYVKITVVYKVGTTTYNWQPGNLTGGVQNVSPAVATTYTVTASSGICTTTSNITITPTTVAGDPIVYGDHVWNVYAWNSGGQYISSSAWSTNYAGYYVDNNLNFNTTTQWNQNASPSAAASWQGCALQADNMSWSAKRRGFPCGWYQLDIGNHDDAAQLYVHGVKVWEHNNCCDPHTNVWTGYLGDTTSVEFRVTEGVGGAMGILNFTIVPVTVTVNGPATICPGYTVNISSNATNVSSYLWSNGATTPTIDAGGGSYSVNVTFNGGCSSSSGSKSIAVAPLDSLQLTSNYTGLSYCPGNYYVDIASTPYNSDLNYTWDSPNAYFYGFNYNYYTYDQYGYSEIYAPGEYTLTASDQLGCSVSAKVVIAGPPGDQSFGDGVWNVSAYQSIDWNSTSYSGYYIDSSLNFSSDSSWNQDYSPSSATGYQGCSVSHYYSSFSARRQGFPCGIYQLDVPGHDDDGQLYVNGVKVWEHVGCCDSHTNVWTGALNANSKVEFRILNYGGGYHGSLNFTMVGGVDTFISVTGNQFVCTGQSYTLTSMEGASYLWSNGATTNPMSASESGSYTVTVTDNAGCVVTSEPVSITILPNAAPVAHINVSATAFCDWNTNPISLSSDSASGNAWSTSDTTASISVTTAGNYMLTVTNSAGCFDQDTVNIANGFTPPAPIASNNGPVCQNTSANLTASGLAPGGQAASFNGNQYVKVFQDIPENNFTIEMWVKTTASDAGIFSVTDDATAAHDRHLFVYGGQLWTRTYPSGDWNSGFTINDGKWHHIALVVKTGVGQIIYVDGVSSGVGDTYDNSQFTWQTSFLIGFSADIYPNSFSGQIDNVRIWNEARTQNDIRSNMMLASPVSSTHLVYQSALNGNVQASVGNNGVNFGGVTFVNPDYYTYSWTGTGAPAPSKNETQTTSQLTTGGVYTVIASSGGCSPSVSSSTTVSVNPQLTYYADADGDGYGSSAASPITSCTNPGSGYASNNDDCNDGNGAVNPAATETCNGIDDDCNGQTDENGLTATITAGGSTAFCFGQSVALNASPEGSSYSYQWYNESGLIAGATNSSFNATVNVNYHVVVSQYLCSASSNTIPVTVYQLPVATATPVEPTTLCKGIPVTINANTGTGLTYQWYKGASAVSGATNATYVTGAADNNKFKVVVTNGQGCSQASNVVTITRLATPVASVIIVNPADNPDLCINGKVKLRGNGSSKITLGYQWYFNNGVLPGATSRDYSATTAGSYKVMVTNVATGCSKLSAAVNVISTCKNTGDPAMGELNAYPNPSNGNFVIDVNLAAQDNQEVIMQLYNALGEMVLQKKVMSVEGKVTENIDLSSEISAGLYLLRVISGDEMYTKQLVIQKP